MTLASDPTPRAEQTLELRSAEPPPAPLSRWRAALLALLALGFGLTTFWDGLYALPRWGLVAVGVLGLLSTLLVAAPATPSRPALIALGGLAAFAGWSLLSALWAESADQALAEGGRWAMYAALLAVLLLLVRDRRLARIGMGACAAAVLAVTAYILGAMLIGDVGAVFLGARLEKPLGYANGQAAFLLLGLWPLIAVAEGARRPVARGLGMSGAFAIAALLVMTQTRAIVPATVLSAAVLLAVVPGRARRAWLLLLVLGGIAVIAAPLLEVYRDTTEATVRRAAIAIVAAAPVAALVWTLAERWLPRLAARRGIAPDRLRRLGGGLAAGLVAAAAVAGAVAVGNPAARVADQFEAFTGLQAAGGESRFLSAGGNRYDYWRIAMLEFSDAPVKGVGAGNYDTRYHAERRTVENIRQPHSLFMQTLAEVGVVGHLLLLAFLGGVFIGLGRTARRARSVEAERWLAVAAGGTFLVWLLHTSIDWLHVVPSLTALGLVAAAALLRGPAEGRLRRPHRVPRAAVIALCAVLIAVPAVIAGRLAVAELFRLDGRAELAKDPRGALRAANTALALNGESLPHHYLKAAALARLGSYRQSREALLDASAREPRDFVTYALLGDLAARRGDLSEAARQYARALRLNPRERAILDQLDTVRGAGQR